MMDSTDMTTPVTRGELREELAQLEQKLEQKLAYLATKRELEFWGGALLARIEASEQRHIALVERTEQRLGAELARHAGAINESISTRFAASDEKYADLPGRVNRLEAAVFTPKQR
jgi:hypothetical protein